MLCHDIEYASKVLVLKLIVIFIIFYLMIIILKPIQDLFQDFNLFEEDSKDWITVEVGEKCASLNLLNSFMVSYMLFQTDKLLYIGFAILSVQT